MSFAEKSILSKLICCILALLGGTAAIVIPIGAIAIVMPIGAILP